MISLMCISVAGSFSTFLGNALKETNRQRRNLMFLGIVLLSIILIAVFLSTPYITSLERGMNMLNDGEYASAQGIFEELDNQEMLLESKYAYAKQLFADGNIQAASEIFAELGNYKSSEQYLQRIQLIISATDGQNDLLSQQNETYSLAYHYYENGQFIRALSYFRALNDFEDSKEMVQKCVIYAREEAAHTISAGISSAIGIKNDGTVLSAGYYNYSDFERWSDIVSISNLGVIIAGLKSDGTVVTTGSYSVDVSNWSDIISISTGERYIVGLRSDGTVVGAGHDIGDGQLQINGWTDIVSIATGWRHTVGLDSDGDIHITGYRSSKQLAEIQMNLSEWSNIIAIAAGGGSTVGTGHTVGLRADGKVVAVGDNTYGQCNVGGWSDIVAIAAGDWHTVGLRADGTVVSTHPDSTKYSNLYSAACDVDAWSDIVEIAAGCGYTLGLHSDGTVIALGYDDHGQLRGTTTWADIRVHSDHSK